MRGAVAVGIGLVALVLAGFWGGFASTVSDDTGVTLLLSIVGGFGIGSIAARIVFSVLEG